MKLKFILMFLIVVFSPFAFFLFFQYISRAAPKSANISIDVTKSLGPFPNRWKALAQGGEEQGVQMLQDVVPQIAGLYPRYIRLDHIYDYYNVISRDSTSRIVLNFDNLDKTVCDIYHTGAKPFFALGYMPEVLSGDTTLVSGPKKWLEWEEVVTKTIEHYSGKSNRLCGQITDIWKTDIHYEVWNEPDLFGKWSIYGGKDYRILYEHSSRAASRAQNVYPFLLGGPVTTALYRNWITNFLDYATAHSLRVDFLSWHHYSKNADDYVTDVTNLNSWLSEPKYQRYSLLPKIISEWGFDSEPNAIADTNIGAAHTIASISNFINTNVESAFLFEIKDGASPRWGILGHDGSKKPRYYALQFLNNLSGDQLDIKGEGTYVKALGTIKENVIHVILVNYDQNNKNTENVPLTLTGMNDGSRQLSIVYLDKETDQKPILQTVTSTGGNLKTSVLLPPNSIALVELTN